MRCNSADTRRSQHTSPTVATAEGHTREHRVSHTGCVSSRGLRTLSIAEGAPNNNKLSMASGIAPHRFPKKRKHAGLHVLQGVE